MAETASKTTAAGRSTPKDLLPENVDARLDNRTGTQRPKVESFPAKPQQVDGPDLMHQAEHTKRTLKKEAADKTNRKGMFSPGPHGLSDDTLREDDEVTFGTEGVKGE